MLATEPKLRYLNPEKSPIDKEKSPIGKEQSPIDKEKSHIGKRALMIRSPLTHPKLRYLNLNIHEYHIQ